MITLKGKPDEILDKYPKDVDLDEQVEKPPEENPVEKYELQLLEEEDDERAKNPIIEKRNFTGI